AAAERLPQLLADALVDLDPAGVDPPRDPQRGPDVSAPDEAGKPVGGGVGLGDHLLLVGPWPRDQNRSEHLLGDHRPVGLDAGEPVNENLSTPAAASSAAPASSPKPGTTLSTPGGRNSWAIAAISVTASGASSAGLRTMQLPVASAIEIFSTAVETGAFQGVI